MYIGFVKYISLHCFFALHISKVCARICTLDLQIYLKYKDTYVGFAKRPKTYTLDWTKEEQRYVH